jgi:hypothetical protein
MSSGTQDLHERPSSRTSARIGRDEHLLKGSHLSLAFALILFSFFNCSISSATPRTPLYTLMAPPIEEPSPLLSVDEHRKSLSVSSIQLEGLSDALSFTLKAQASSARLWWTTWTSIFGGFALYNAIPAMLNTAPLPPLGQATPQVLWTNGVKSLLGALNMMIRPYSSLHAAQDFERALMDPSISLSEAVRQGERSLMEAVREKNRRYGMFRHLSSALVNVIGGLVLYYGYNDLGGALRTSTLGIVSSQVYIWTQPGSADKDLRSYQRLKARLNPSSRLDSAHLVEALTKALNERPPHSWSVFSGFGSVFLRLDY